MGTVYEIICWTTGLRYIGSTTLSLKERLVEHKKPRNKLSSRYIIEYNNYEIYDLEKCDNEIDLRIREDYHIRHTDCVNERVVLSGRKVTLSNYNSSKKGKDTHKKYRKTDKYKVTQQQYKQTETYKNYRKLKVICECGVEHLKVNINEHKKSKTHKKFIGEL
jgi:hypothetical protein